MTLICERPKVKPHRQAMRERLAELLSLPLDAVSVKATTTEAMGFTGRGEGLARRRWRRSRYRPKRRDFLGRCMLRHRDPNRLT